MSRLSIAGITLAVVAFGVLAFLMFNGPIVGQGTRNGARSGPTM
jgi:hypothetical protein